MTTIDTLPDTAHELARLIDHAAEKLGQISLTHAEDIDIVRTMETLEKARRRMSGIDVRLISEVAERNIAAKYGSQTPMKFIGHHLRLGVPEVKRRTDAWMHLAQRYSFTGEMLQPLLPHAAQAVTAGEISMDHVKEIIAMTEDIPAAIAPEVADHAEAQLVEIARQHTPEDTRVAGKRILEHLDPDGELTDDADRKRTRGVTLAPQDRRLMTNIKGRLTPEARAKLDALLELWAAPGMNNPDDPQSPRGASTNVDPAVLTAARERDDRSAAQRNHDALDAMWTFLLANGGLGDSDTLAAHLVVTASLSDLENRTGVATTTTGARVPVKDLVELAGDATPWLAVFADASEQVLYFGRSRRIASKAQRLALFGRDRGCTAPGCTQPWAHSQVHHVRDWADGGSTDIDNLGGACGPDNRKVKNRPGGWETRIIDTGAYAGRVGWRPFNSFEPWTVNHTLRIDDLVPDPPGRVSDSGSAIEKWLACRLPAPPIVIIETVDGQDPA